MADYELRDLTVKESATISHPVLPAIPFNMIAIGSSYSGKTNLIANLLTRREFYKGKMKVYWFTGSPDATQRSIPGVKLFDNLDPLETILEAAGKAKAAGSKTQYLVVIDDMATDKLLNKRRGILTDAFIKGRHSNVSVILTAQQYHLVPKWLREASLSAILFKATGRERDEIVRDNLCPEVDELTLGRWYDRATSQRYNFLYIDRRRCKYWHNFTRQFNP